MDDRAHMAWLLDFYGPLLTGRQRELLDQHLNEDLSLAEIAALEGITRQGVHDTIKKAQARLARFERQLGLLRRYFALLDGSAEALSRLNAGDVPGARALLGDIISVEGDTDGV